MRYSDSETGQTMIGKGFNTFRVPIMMWVLARGSWTISWQQG